MMRTTLIMLFASFQIFAATDVRLLSDNVPDWHDLPSAAYSMTNSLASDEQKAIAITKWVASIRHQISPAKDSFSEATVPAGHPTYGIVYNPIKLANNYGNTFCVSTNSIPALIWRQLGKQSREYDINAHTVCDLYWGGAWRNFDPAFGFFYKDTATYELIGCQEIVNRRNSMYSMMSDFTSANRFDPSKRANMSIYQAKTVYNILIGTAEYSRIDATRTTLYTEQYSDSYTYRVNFKPFERYARLGRQIADDIKYYLPKSSSETANPNTYSGVNLNVVTNGIWTFAPDLSSNRFSDAVSVMNGIAQNSASPKLRPTTTTDTASFIYKVEAGNIICHAELSATIVRANENSSFEIWFSADSTRWFRIFNATQTGAHNINIQFGRNTDVAGQTGLPSNIARTRTAYYLKFNMKSESSATDCGIDNLTIKTYTIVNPRTMPIITLGSNRIKLKAASGMSDPLDVSYHWTEIDRNSGSSSAKTTFRSYTKRVTTAGEEWVINTAGIRNPTMDSIIVAWAGHTQATEGYSDGTDVGVSFEAPRYYYTFGKNIAVNKTVSATPETTNTSLITDNNAGTNAISPTWTADKNPKITIDLGAVFQTQGIRIVQQLLSGSGEYFDSCRTFTQKTSGENWTYQGTFYQRQAWEPITNYLMPNTYDTPLHYRLKNRNLLHAKFSHAFDSPDSARYVRLEFFNSRGRLDIQEIEVYDRMTKTRVNNEVDHGFTLPDPSFTASDIGISAETNFSKAKGAVFASIEAMPNPFNPNITIIVNGINAHAELSIISPNGTRVVKSTIASSVPFVWNATDKMAAGVYIVRIKTIHGVLTKKVVLSK